MEDLKNILVCDLFYIITLDTTRQLPKTTQGTKYILVAIDHYSEWCETKVVYDHVVDTVARFLKENIICRYGVLKFILKNKDGEWLAKFDNLCKVYGIQH